MPHTVQKCTKNRFHSSILNSI